MTAQAVRLTNVDIDQAFAERRFALVYQPSFDLKTGAVTRLEAFARWRHPVLGELPPGAFLSLIESQGRTFELTRFAIEQALADLKEFEISKAGVTVNISQAEIYAPEFPEQLSIALRKNGVTPERLSLDCVCPSEQDLEAYGTCIHAIRSLGVKLSIEARGRTVSSLRAFNPFPFDEIKAGGPTLLRFARSVYGSGVGAVFDLLSFAKEVGARIVAVGVEDEETFAAVKAWGFDAAQGAYLMRPCEIDELAANRFAGVQAKILQAGGQQSAAAPLRSADASLFDAAGDVRSAAPKKETAEAESGGVFINLDDSHNAGARALADAVDVSSGAAAQSPARDLQHSVASAFMAGDLGARPQEERGVAEVRIVKAAQKLARREKKKSAAQKIKQPAQQAGDIDLDIPPLPRQRLKIRGCRSVAPSKRSSLYIYGFWPRGWKRFFNRFTTVRASQA